LNKQTSFEIVKTLVLIAHIFCLMLRRNRFSRRKSAKIGVSCQVSLSVCEIEIEKERREGERERETGKN
jgi:hypothetical protein